MPIHPMFNAVRVEGGPDEPGIYKIEIAYPAGRWRFEDRAYSSPDEARADIPTLQAQGRLPKNSELFAE